MQSMTTVLDPDLSPARHHFFTEVGTEIIYRKIVRPGDTVLDLGANRAHHSTRLLQAVGESGRVHAFEPNPELFAGLAALGANLRLWPHAVGDCLRMVELHVPEGLDGWSSLQDIRGELPDRHFRIYSAVQVAIDEIAELADTSASFVKIDVERREKEAIGGMLRYLSRCEPVVICEGNLSENFAALEKIGYRCFDFFGQAASGDNILANFLACPQSWQDRIDQLLPTGVEWDEAKALAMTLKI